MVLAVTREINLPARSAGKRSNCCCNSGGSCHVFLTSLVSIPDIYVLLSKKRKKHPSDATI
jgi:hypothetical protein